MKKTLAVFAVMFVLMFATSASAQVVITSNGIQMNVLDPALVTVDPVGYNIYETEDIVLSVTAPDATIFQWRKDTIPIDGIANPSALTANLTIPVAMFLTDQGDYDCVVNNVLGIPDTSLAATVNVYTWPTIVETVIPTDTAGVLNIATGANADFTVTIAAAGANPMLPLPGAVGIQWNKDGAPALINANMTLNTVTYTGDLLTFTGVINPDDDGFYECVVTCTAP